MMWGASSAHRAYAIAIVKFQIEIQFCLPFIASADQAQDIFQ